MTVPVPAPVVLTVSTNVGIGENVAVTGTAAVPIVKLHVPVPVQPPPLQPANTEPEAGVAVRVTLVLVLTEALQVPGQLIPFPVTVPLPVPANVTLTGNAVGMKSALTDCAEFIVTVHAPVPAQAPLHPLNTDPAAAVGVSVTAVPLLKSNEHVLPQLMPAGLLVIDPEPAPVRRVVRVNFDGAAGPKVAVTARLELSVMSHAALPLQAPDQPVNTEPEAGVAARLTIVPEAKLAEHVVPQLSPAGELETLPEPVPASVTPSVKSGANVAPTDAADVTGTTHGPVPVQKPPVHPVKAKPGAGVAVRVTVVPELNEAVQVVAPEPQAIPDGLLVISPFAVGARVIVSGNCCAGGGPKFATTDLAADIVTAQAPVPLQAPDHPRNADPDPGTAARLTVVPKPKLAEHVVPQLIPAGKLVTVPLPVPDLLTVKANAGMNVACTARSEVRSTEHVPVPEQADPFHPAKTEPDAAVAVSVIAVPGLKGAEHVAPQLIPAGALVIVPDPVPFALTLKTNCGGAAGPKLATTLWSELRETLHPPEPAHAPPQPVKMNPCAGATVTATLVPETKLVVQLLPQLMPAGLLMTVPPFAGTAWTASVCGAAGELDGVLEGLLGLEFPVSMRVIPDPPPQEVRMMVETTMSNAQNFGRRPPNWFTNSSCTGAKRPFESLGPMLARRSLSSRQGENSICGPVVLNTDTAIRLIFQADSRP